MLRGEHSRMTCQALAIFWISNQFFFARRENRTRRSAAHSGGSMLLTTGVVLLAASRMLTLLSPQANSPASGLRLTAIAVVVSIAVALLGLSGTRR